MGRCRFDRGKEPTYISDRAGWFPFSIPGHPGTLKKGTARNILNQLEHDMIALEVDVDDDSAEERADTEQHEEEHEDETE